MVYLNREICVLVISHNQHHRSWVSVNVKQLASNKGLASSGSRQIDIFLITESYTKEALWPRNQVMCALCAHVWSRAFVSSSATKRNFTWCVATALMEGYLVQFLTKFLDSHIHTSESPFFVGMSELGLRQAALSGYKWSQEAPWGSCTQWSAWIWVYGSVILSAISSLYMGAMIVGLQFQSMLN